MVDAARIAAVEVQESRARSSDVSRQRRQHRDGAHDVAATRLALEALAHPEQRRPSPVGARGVLDERCRHAGLLLGPGRGTRIEQRLELVVAEHVVAYEGLVDEAVPADHVRERERERGIAARAKLEVGVGSSSRRGADGVDHDHLAARLAQPVVVGVGRTGRWVRTPDDDALRRRRGLGVEALLARAVDVAERDVARVVADRVRLHLGRAEAVEEALRKGPVDQRARARVVRVEDARRAVPVRDRVQMGRDRRDRVGPVDRLEARLALRPDPAEWRGQPHLGIDERAVVADRALAAELAAGDVMIRIAADVLDAPVLERNQHAAGVVAVARARGAHRLHQLMIAGGVG